ncbi:hypothetical protein [Butyrivibrio sp. FCS014]|uniref:hypothetical protein n=1 Tax=Butyrivibrio sp. FCS014 TaxID=1408304 RepID=UPI0024182283
MGTFSKEAYEFVDFLKDAGQRLLGRSFPLVPPATGFSLSVLLYLCRKPVLHRY